MWNSKWQLSLVVFCLKTCLLHSQGEYEFSPEILSAKLAEVVYKDATSKIKGRFYNVFLSVLKTSKIKLEIIRNKPACVSTMWYNVVSSLVLQEIIQLASYLWSMSQLKSVETAPLITTGHWTFVRVIFLCHRGRVCHLASEHRRHLWLHQRSPGPHSARVRHHLIYLLKHLIDYNGRTLRVTQANLTPKHAAWLDLVC